MPGASGRDQDAASRREVAVGASYAASGLDRLWVPPSSVADVRRKYTEELLTELVATSSSVSEVLRRLGLSEAGGTHAHMSRMIKKFGLDTSHFVRHQNGAAKVRLRADQILVRLIPGSPRRKPHQLHRALLETGRDYRCALCGCDGTWLGRPLRLEIDHIDGDYHDNEAWNLRFLCPNCHTQTDTFSGRSRNKYVNADGQLALFGTVHGESADDS